MQDDGWGALRERPTVPALAGLALIGLGLAFFRADARTRPRAKSPGA